MWKPLYFYKKPEKFYYFCRRLIPFFAIPAAVLLFIGWLLGFGFAPVDYQQGDSFRIIYLHVPAAIWSMLIYAFMAIAAFVGLIFRSKQANEMITAMAPVGAVFTFIALATGAIWGKPMWGTWWVWDARLTSELVLLFLYLGVIGLSNAFDDRRLAGQAVAILVLVGVVNLPIIHFSVEWWNTLHQGSTNMHQSIAPSMRTPLRLVIFGYLFFFLTLTLMRWCNLIIESERHHPWVDALIYKKDS